MNRATWGLLAVFLAASPAIPFFKFQRHIEAGSSAGQHYFVVDESVWQHALPDLDDLRLYTAGKEIPYAGRTMRGSRQTEQIAVHVLQPGTIGGKTQFFLDMQGAAEYDRVVLTLRTRNYVAHARVDGQDDLHGTQWANLGTTTLFDLSDEKLGHNSTLQIPVSTYKYLRITLENIVKPSEIQGGAAGIERAQEAVWRDVSGEPKRTEEGKDTVLTFRVPQGVPAERLALSIDTAQGNFQREIEMQSEKGATTRLGEISRIHLQRNGGRIDVDQTSLTVFAANTGQVRAVIHNGDDSPLKITNARLQQYERRIYFDCDAGASPELYYGDQKLDAPVYEYAKFFQADANAAQLQLNDELLNSTYTGRPDSRPWSERHPALLWAAILAAVGLLGGIAVRSIRAAA
jgi:hypothetical protein